jgi:phosphomevalonate kinase
VIEARAPGKLVIAGEYAVLAGGPGIAAAVDLPATARITTRSGGGNVLRIPETGATHPFRWIASGPPRWEQSAPGALGRPLEAVVETLYARRLLARAGDLPPCLIELSTDAFYWTDDAGSRHKLGLGSSAAVLVALCGALLRFIGGGPVDQAELLALCWEAHRRFQGGAGSGLDVATALAGGVIAAEFDGPGTVPRVTPLAWPRKLEALALWTGVSASTPALLARLKAWQDRDPPAAATALARLSGAAARCLAAWRTGDPGVVLDALADFAGGLRVLDEGGNLGIWSREHLALQSLAGRHGVLYKPSGAGGGDFGLAFSQSREDLEALGRAAEKQGFLCLEMPLGGPGLAVSGSGSGRGGSLVRTRTT